MIVVLVGFWFFVALFQIISTILVHGMGLVSGGIIGGTRDLIWMLIILSTMLVYRQYLRSYVRLMMGRRTARIGLVVFGVIVSWVNAYYRLNPMMDWYSMDNLAKLILLGFKYGLLYRGIMLSATWIGYLGSHLWTYQQWKALFHRYTIIIILIVVGGLVWQGAKMLWPDLFMSLGYGGLSDFVGNAKPPLYYLTSYQGFPRLSGLFSGPNEYGYLLITIFSLLCLSYGSGRGRRPMRVTYVFSLFATVSRGALIGVGVQLVIRYWRRFYQWVIIGGVISVGVVIAISIWKPESTSTHLMSKVWNAKLIVNQPLGYGFGISGPSIHYNSCHVCLRAEQCALQPGGVCPYCDCYLPENVYMQFLMEIGVIGFLGWCIMTWLRYRHIIRLIQDTYLSKHQVISFLSQMMYALVLGFSGLLVEGLFLHVFESSMIHYLFFVPLGLVWGGLVAHQYSNNL